MEAIPEYKRPENLLVIMLAMLTAFGSLSIDMYLPAFPDIGLELGATPSQLELSLSTFFAGFALGQLVYGPVSDRYGRRAPLYFGLIAYTLASLGCFFAKDIHAFLILRLVQALGGCAGVIVSRAVVRDQFDRNHAARVFSLLMLVMGVSPILAPLLGGAIATHLGWRWIFGLLALFGAVCLLTVHFRLPETSSIESRAGHSLHPLRVMEKYISILKDRSFLGYTLAGTLAMSGVFAYIAGSPFVMIELYHVPKAYYGWVFGINAFGLIAASQINARLLSRFAFDRMLRCALGTMFFTGLMLLGLALFDNDYRLVLPTLFVFVASIGFVGPNYTSGALNQHGARAGSASALLGAFQFGLAMLASLAVSHWHNGTAVPMMAVMFGCILLSVLSYIILKPYRYLG